MEPVKSDNIMHISSPNEEIFYYNGVKVSLKALRLIKDKMIWKDGRFVIEDLNLEEEKIIEEFVYQ